MKDNLEIVKPATCTEQLAEDEYYALMVTDLDNRGKRPRKDYLDFEKGWLGLERTDTGIYVSKICNTYWDSSRGRLLVVKVKPTDKICLLGDKK